MNTKTPQADLHTLILQAVARGWCSPENAPKVMDCDLAEAITREVIAALTPAAGEGLRKRIDVLLSAIPAGMYSNNWTRGAVKALQDAYAAALTPQAAEGFVLVPGRIEKLKAIIAAMRKRHDLVDYEIADYCDRLDATLSALPAAGNAGAVRESMLRHWLRELNRGRNNENVAGEVCAYLHAALTAALSQAATQDGGDIPSPLGDWHEAALADQPAAGVEYEFEVWQDDNMQAGGTASTFDCVFDEAEHYALMYGQDGPTEIRYYERRRVDAAALLAAQEAARE